MTISKDRVKPSPLPDSWKLAEIFTTGVILGSYLAMMTVIFFWAAYKTDFFPVNFSTSHSPITISKRLNGLSHVSICLNNSVHSEYPHLRKQLTMTSGS